MAVMKGRGNFLCREKVYRMGDQPVLKGMDEAGLVHADSRLGKADGDGRPRGTEFSARRFGPVGAAGRAPRRVHRFKMRGVQPLFPHGDAPARRRGRPDHRQSPSFFRGSGAAGRTISAASCRNMARWYSTRRTRSRTSPAITLAGRSRITASRNWRATPKCRPGNKGRRHGTAEADRPAARARAELFRGFPAARGPLSVRQTRRARLSWSKTAKPTTRW